jgi:hypothetical protein
MFRAEMSDPQFIRQLEAEIEKGADAVVKERGPMETEDRGKIPSGLLSLGEDDPWDIGEDDVFQGDDITSHGHMALDVIREQRAYARVAAWEMPLLSSTCQFTDLRNHS